MKELQLNIKILNNEEYLKELNIKLQEEVKEYLESEAIEEVADIQEVLLAIIKAKNVSAKGFEKIRKEKVESRGAFERKLFLIDVEE